MLSLMIISILVFIVVVLLAILKGLIAISPFLLIICIFPVMDYFLLRWLFKRKK